MKYLLTLIVLCLCVGCRSERARTSWTGLETKRTEIQADGVVTPQEAEAYLAAVEAHLQIEREEFEKTDWAALLAAGAGSVVASFLGVNAYRNRSLPGATRKPTA